MDMQVQYHAMTGVLTYLIVSVPATLGKIFKQTPTGLEKTTAGEFCEGKFVVKFFRSWCLKPSKKRSSSTSSTRSVNPESS